MGALVTFIVISIVYAAFGILGAILTRVFNKGPNSGTIQMMFLMSAVCTWMFWALAFLHQVNPLLGPELSAPSLLWIGKEWQWATTKQP